MGNAIFYDLCKQEGNSVIYTLEEWRQLINEYDQIEADNAALRECILAMENDQAFLPEDFSVTEYVTALQKQGERLYKLLYAGFRVVNIGGHLSKQWLLDVKQALEARDESVWPIAYDGIDTKDESLKSSTHKVADGE